MSQNQTNVAKPSSHQGSSGGSDPTLSATTQCPHCKGWFKVPSKAVGKNARCVQCKEPFLVERRVPGTTPVASTPAVVEEELLGMHPALRRPMAPQTSDAGAALRRPMAPKSSDAGAIKFNDTAIMLDPPSISPGSFLILGLLLIIGMVMPLVMIVSGFGQTETTISFMNFEALGQDMLPGVVKFMFVYPLLAGIALIVLGMSVTGKIRATAALAIGALPIVVLASNESFRQVFAGMIESGHGSSVLSPILMLGGWAAIVAGCWSMKHCPVASAPVIVGSIGVGLFGLWLATPVGGELPFVQTFASFGTADTIAAMSMTVAMAAFILLNAIAGVFIIVGAIKPLQRYELARRAFTCVMLGITTLVLLTFLGSLAVSQEMEFMSISIVSLFLMNLKMFAWLGGMLLLLPVALADLLISISPQPGNQADPDLVGSR